MAEQLTKIKSQIMKTSDIIIGFLGERPLRIKKEGHHDIVIKISQTKTAKVKSSEDNY